MYDRRKKLTSLITIANSYIKMQTKDTREFTNEQIQYDDSHSTSESRNPMCKQKTLDVRKSVRLAQADGQYSPGCSLFVNMASSGWFWWVCSSKKGGFHCFTVMIRVRRV